MDVPWNLLSSSASDLRNHDRHSIEDLSIAFKKSLCEVSQVSTTSTTICPLLDRCEHLCDLDLTIDSNSSFRPHGDENGLNAIEPEFLARSSIGVLHRKA